MVAIRRVGKPYQLKPGRPLKRKPGRPPKSPASQRKLPSGSKKGPKGQTSKESPEKPCPLMSWSFGKLMGENAQTSQKAKAVVTSIVGRNAQKAALRAGNVKKSRRIVRTCSDFLKAALREVAGKKKAAGKRKPRYSDEEIFYKMANATEEEWGPSSDPNPSTSEMVTRPPTPPSPIANEPQPVST